MVECNSKACEIITETICPLFGMVTAYFIFLSPFKEIQFLRKKSCECNINPIPCIMVFCNCLSQILYSYTIHNHWNYWPNFGGIIIGLYYVVVVYSSKLKNKEWTISTITLLGFTLLNIIGGALAFILFDDNYEAAKLSMGIICIIILCGIYISPLTTMIEIIRTKDSSSISFIMTVALFINGIFWTAYGIFYNDFFIWFPNALGIGSSVIQFIFFFIFPRKQKNSNSNDSEVSTAYTVIGKDEDKADTSSDTLQNYNLHEKDLSDTV